MNFALFNVCWPVKRAFLSIRNGSFILYLGQDGGCHGISACACDLKSRQYKSVKREESGLNSSDSFTFLVFFLSVLGSTARAMSAYHLSKAIPSTKSLKQMKEQSATNPSSNTLTAARTPQRALLPPWRRFIRNSAGKRNIRWNKSSKAHGNGINTEPPAEGVLSAGG
jgi:hypothetical protein